MVSKRITVTDEYVRVFDIPFLRGGYPAARKKLAGGGFMIVPSAPSLVPIRTDEYYYRSLKASDFAIPDSGFMVLMLRLFYRVGMERLSGLEFLQSYLHDQARRGSPGIFMVEPTVADHDANQQYLRGIGIEYDPAACYVAPVYAETEIRDFKLLEAVEAQRPGIILINLGGGVQERVGYFLKENLSYKPAIICTGAAIAFLSGRQVQIPKWADYLYLGWLFRSFSNPRRFIPRYLYGLRLVPMLLGCSVVRSAHS